jgi:hypothetical protein
VQARYGTTRARHDVAGGEMADVWDGSILENLFHRSSDGNKEDVVYFMAANDGVEVEDGVSYTPIVGQVLNFPPKLRGLLGQIVLFGYLPPKVCFSCCV